MVDHIRTGWAEKIYTQTPPPPEPGKTTTRNPGAAHTGEGRELTPEAEVEENLYSRLGKWRPGLFDSGYVVTHLHTILLCPISHTQLFTPPPPKTISQPASLLLLPPPQKIPPKKTPAILDDIQDCINTLYITGRKKEKGKRRLPYGANYVNVPYVGGEGRGGEPNFYRNRI